MSRRHHYAPIDAAGIPGYAMVTNRTVRDFYGLHGYAFCRWVAAPGGANLSATTHPPIPGDQPNRDAIAVEHA